MHLVIVSSWKYARFWWSRVYNQRGDFIFGAMHPIYICILAFITWLHESFSTIWNDCFYNFLYISAFFILSIHIWSFSLCMAVHFFLCLWSINRCWLGMDVWIELTSKIMITMNCVCILYEICWRSFEGKASFNQVSSIPERETAGEGQRTGRTDVDEFRGRETDKSRIQFLMPDVSVRSVSTMAQ